MMTMNKPQTYDAQPETREAADETVEVVIAPPIDPAALFKFSYQFQEELEDRQNSRRLADIVHSYGSCHDGAVISIAVRDGAFGVLLERLARIAVVQGVEREPLLTLGFLNPPGRPHVLRRTDVLPNKRVHLALRKVTESTPCRPRQLVFAEA